MVVSSIKNSAKPKKNLVLYLVLAITLALTAWLAFNGSGEPEALSAIEIKHQTRVLEPPSQSVSRIEQTANGSSLDKVNQAHSQPPFNPLFNRQVNLQSSTHKIQDLFKPHTWFVAPPVKKVVLLPLPPPVAPPAPFNYLGKLEDSPKGTLIFLMANNTLYSVFKGEKINQQWRLDSEDANTIKLTYLPLQLTQVLIKSAKYGAEAAAASVPVDGTPIENNL